MELTSTEQTVLRILYHGHRRMSVKEVYDATRIHRNAAAVMGALERLEQMRLIEGIGHSFVAGRDYRFSMGFATAHTIDTPNPQTYRQHWRNAFMQSLILLWYCVEGIIHAFFPEVKRFQFSTSSAILRATKVLVESGRHDDEIAAIYGKAFAAHAVDWRTKRRDST